MVATRLIHKIKAPLWRLKRRALLNINYLATFGKINIIHTVAKRHKLKNYLELCTSTTGNYYADIIQSRFNTSRRLMYNCPADFDDGLPIDFRIKDFDISVAVKALKANRNKIDICLVDGWHTYDCAIRDLTLAFDMIADGGVLVVHDCLPPTQLSASPTPQPGEWCGASYRAYLDFVLNRDDLDYCTVNADYGCGIIFKNRTINLAADILPPACEPRLVREWSDIHHDDHQAYEYITRNQLGLLRLITPTAFLRFIGGRE